MPVTKIEKNKSIEFYRFVLSLPILFMHISSSTALLGTKFNRGGIAVECFFVLSGFLLANSFITDDGTHILSSAKGKLKKQILHIFPYYYICLITTFVCKFCYYEKYGDFSTQKWGQFFENFFVELLCLSGLSYRTLHVNGPGWYISALLISSFFVTLIYLFLKRFYSRKYKYFVWGGTFIGFTIYLLAGEDFSSRHLIIRAVINILIGVSFFEICNITKVKIQNISIWCCDVIEIIILIGMIVCFYPTINIDVRIISILFGILIILQFGKKTHLATLLDNSISEFLGRISLPIYLGQMLIICIYAFWGKYDITTNRIKSYILIAADVILWSIILEFAISYIRNKGVIKYSLQTKYILLIVSVLLFIHSFSAEQIFFDMENMNKAVYWVCKILLLCIEVAVPQILYKEFKNRDNRRSIVIFACIFAIYLLFILASWPGNWNNDEFLILGTVKQFNIQFHQSLFTSLFFILSLMIIPSCGGIILFQGIICATIATKVICVCYKEFGKIAYLLVAVFLSPLTIYYVLYPLRVCLYTFVFLLLVTLVLEIIHNDCCDTKRMVIIGILCAIVSTWRTESIFLIIMIPVIIIIQIINKQMDKKFICQILIASILPFLLFMKVNTYKDEQIEKTATLWSFTTGMSVLLQNDDLKSPDLETDLSNIDKVMNIDKMVENWSATDLYTVYNASGPYEYTDDEYKECLKSIARLIICNPIKYAETKWELFKVSSGMGEGFWLSTPISKESAYEIVNIYGVSDSVLKIYNPYNEQIREGIVYGLTGMTSINDEEGMATYKISMQSWIAELILLITTLIMIVKRKLMFLGVDILILCDFILVYLTAPSANVMYFFPFTVIGVCVAFYELMCILRSRKNMR